MRHPEGETRFPLGERTGGELTGNVSARSPETIGRHRVLGVLGAGGMGTVYRGEDPLLKRPVALKVVQGGLREQEEALKRFRREAEISARLNHPNVITIYDVGEDPAVGPFIAMELVEGRSLSTLLREESPTREARLSYLVQAARALAAAHAAAIVHRDVKSQNLIVSRDGRVKLMDFGVARREDSSLTATGAVLGTPAYLAPEQLDGAPPSAVTDTYALAVVAVETLCGQRPWTANSISKLVYQIAHVPPSFPKDVDPRLRAVFEKALAKSPADRYGDPLSLLRAILGACPIDEASRRRFLAALGDPYDELAGTGAAGAPATPVASSGRRPLAAAVVAGLLGAAAAGAWIFLTPAPRILRVETTPPGASVVVDDVAIGRTPVTGVPIPADARALRVELAGHRPAEASLAADRDEFRFDLVRLPLRFPLRTEPPGAEVLLDGSPVGRTPIDALEVPATGRHVVRLRLEGHEERTVTIDGEMPPEETLELARIEPPPPPPEASAKPATKPEAPRRAAPPPPKAAPARRAAAPAAPAPETAAAPAEPAPAEEKPGFWRGVGRGFGEIGKGFRRFGETIRDTTSDAVRGDD